MSRVLKLELRQFQTKIFPMSMLFWIVRGAGSSTFFSHDKELLTFHRPSLVIFVEPRISGVKAERVLRRFGFDEST